MANDTNGIGNGGADEAALSRRGKRTDAHRVGAIIPADYTYLLSYSLPRKRGTEDFDEGYGHDCGDGKHGGDRCCAAVVAQSKPAASHGGLGTCTVCGAHFLDGDVWLHGPTGEVIHVGHNCADKYELLANRSVWEMARARAEQALKVRAIRRGNESKREKFLAEHPGLGEDLAIGDRSAHPILRDLAAKFIRWCSLSEKQIALAHKLAEEHRNPAPPKPEEAHVPAPEGKTVVEGVVVSVRSQDGDYGTTVKMTVKVTTEAGTWLAWGTCPQIMLDAVFYSTRTDREHGAMAMLRGCRVRFTATLTRGRDAHFALFKRPTKAAVLAGPDGAPILSRLEPVVTVQANRAAAQEWWDAARAGAAAFDGEHVPPHCVRPLIDGSADNLLVDREAAGWILDWAARLPGWSAGPLALTDPAVAA